MNRRAVVRYVMLGALVTGLTPLTGAGVDAAGAGQSPAALCQSIFGERGPAGGPVAGEGPSGDPMSTTIGWDPFDWSGGLSEIVTCVSVGGQAAPALTAALPTPRNDGSRAISLTLPPGEPGSLVCEQSVLVGLGDLAGRHRTTSPVCFKLRAAEPPPGSAGPVPDRVMSPGPAAPVGPPVAAPAPKAPANAAAPAPYPASTPPARAAFEAARGGSGFSVAQSAVTPPPSAAGDPAPAWPPDPAPAARAGRQPAAAASPAATAQAAAGAQPGAGAPSTALARTGIEEHIPLASAGGALALGGAAIILGAPGRRRRPARRSV